MELVVTPNGEVRFIYAEAVDLKALGSLTIARGSYVEPDDRGQWHTDLSPVQGPRLGPFELRSSALTAEVKWLAEHWLAPLSRSNES